MDEQQDATPKGKNHSKGLNRVGSFPLHLKKEIISKMLCLEVNLEFLTMDKVHKPSDSECHTPPSKRFKCYFYNHIVYTNLRRLVSLRMYKKRQHREKN
jgi:hypothetical protein